MKIPPTVSPETKIIAISIEKFLVEFPVQSLIIDSANPSLSFLSIFFKHDNNTAKTSAWTSTANTDVRPDIQIFFPSAGRVNRSPGERRMKRRTS